MIGSWPLAHDVFLSHSSKDKAAADAACNVLERNGIRVWMAPRDIMPGMGWAKSIIGGIAGAKVMVLMFSSHANASPQVEREVERAINKSIPIVPFRVENVQPNEALEYFISSPHWLDAFTPPIEQHFERLVLAVKHLLASGYVREDDPRQSEEPASGPADDTAIFADSELERSETSDAERCAIQDEAVRFAQTATLRAPPGSKPEVLPAEGIADGRPDNEDARPTDRQASSWPLIVVNACNEICGSKVLTRSHISDKMKRRLMNSMNILRSEELIGVYHQGSETELMLKFLNSMGISWSGLAICNDGIHGLWLGKYKGFLSWSILPKKMLNKSYHSIKVNVIDFNGRTIDFFPIYDDDVWKLLIYLTSNAFDR